MSLIAASGPPPPNRHTHEYIEEGPGGTEDPLRRVPRRFGQIGIPLLNTGRRRVAADASDCEGGEEKEEKSDPVSHGYWRVESVYEVCKTSSFGNWRRRGADLVVLSEHSFGVRTQAEALRFRNTEGSQIVSFENSPHGWLHSEAPKIRSGFLVCSQDRKIPL